MKKLSKEYEDCLPEIRKLTHQVVAFLCRELIVLTDHVGSCPKPCNQKCERFEVEFVVKALHQKALWFSRIVLVS